MTTVLGVDTRPNPRECEEAVPPITANHDTEELDICAFGSSAKRIVDKRSDSGKEFRVEFVDWCKGISDIPNSWESF